MKLARWLPLTALTALTVGVGGMQEPAIATSFSNTEVDQNRFVLLATSGGSRLTILEQVSDSRPCWRETAGVVEPLLLGFDFTGICSRGTDRNGYSVRVEGQDLGLVYTLRTATQGNTTLLYAVPSRRNSPTLEIGRTRTNAAGFNRISLNSGWRLTRRVYQGRPLGHIYLTNDRSLASLGTSSPIATLPTTTPPTTTSPTPAVPRPTPQPIPGGVVRPAQPGTSIVIPVPPPATGTISTGTTPGTGTVPVSGTRPTAPPISGSPLPPPPPVIAAGTGDVAVLPVPGMPPTSSGQRPPGDPTVAVNGTYPPVYLGTPQPASPVAASLGFSYRVVVQGNSPDIQTRVRAVVPDAFRTIVNGQVVMQAGLFRDRLTADAMLQRLNQQNLMAAVVPVN